MAQNRVRELRRARGLTVQQLADAVGLSHTHISRIENGQRGLSLEVAEALATAMTTTAANVLGIDTGTAAVLAANGTGAAENRSFRGVAEDAAPYTPAHDELPIAPRAGANVDPWIVKSRALDKLGIVPGTILYVSIAADAVAAVAPLQVVVAQIYDEDHDKLAATTVLRQFVPPSLLITNTAGESAPILDLDKGEAVIKGVVVGHYHPRP